MIALASNPPPNPLSVREELPTICQELSMWTAARNGVSKNHGTAWRVTPADQTVVEYSIKVRLSTKVKLSTWTQFWRDLSR